MSRVSPMPDPRIEFDSDGCLDEFVAHDADVHFEAMGPGQWWIGVTLPDGREWHINCGAANPRAATYVNCEQV
ncbi:hypothetical protein [Prescottella equi]|uniref:hypothetical protein n=1 Tax=Rhodococcus hoagii TaxID=43767 RepID=UPI001EEBDA6F|nr:hypothetical protein [Prescottella equi]